MKKLSYNQLQALFTLVVVIIGSISFHDQVTRDNTPPEVYPIVFESSLKPIPLPTLPVVKASYTPQNQSKKLQIDSYLDLPMPTGVGEAIHFKELLGAVSSITGVDKKILMKFAAIESSFNPKAKPKNKGVTAEGLFQFTEDTWVFATNRHGKNYGVTAKVSRSDPRANALMAGFHIRSNIDLIKSQIDKDEITAVDIYLTHLLGRTGSLRFLKTEEDAVIARMMPKAAKNNAKFFYAKGKALTREEVYMTLDSHIKEKIKEFNISV